MLWGWLGWSAHCDEMFSFEGEGVGQRRWLHNPRSRSPAHGNMGDILSSYYTPVVVLNLNCRQCVFQPLADNPSWQLRILSINNSDTIILLLILISWNIVQIKCQLPSTVCHCHDKINLFLRRFTEDGFGKDSTILPENLYFIYILISNTAKCAVLSLQFSLLISNIFRQSRYLLKLINVTSTSRLNRSTSYNALSLSLSLGSRYFKKFAEGSKQLSRFIPRENHACYTMRIRKWMDARVHVYTRTNSHTKRFQRLRMVYDP